MWGLECQLFWKCMCGFMLIILVSVSLCATNYRQRTTWWFIWLINQMPILAQSPAALCFGLHFFTPTNALWLFWNNNKTPKHHLATYHSLKKKCVLRDGHFHWISLDFKDNLNSTWRILKVKPRIPLQTIRRYIWRYYQKKIM